MCLIFSASCTIYCERWYKVRLVSIPLRSKKAGRFEEMLNFCSRRPIVTRASRVSRGPTHNNLLLFLILMDLLVIVSHKIHFIAKYIHE